VEYIRAWGRMGTAWGGVRRREYASVQGDGMGWRSAETEAGDNGL